MHFELGFVAEFIRTGYPNCEAKWRVSQKGDKWERVRIEFEYCSRNFDHDPNGCDLIVCAVDKKKPIINRLTRRLRKKYVSVKKELDWKELYGLGKGLWKKEDAREFVNCLREDWQ